MTRYPAAIALGSNLGDRRANLEAALDAVSRLEGTALTRVSGFIETAPIVPDGARAGAGGAYLNAAAMLSTSLEPRELLDGLLSIERSLGRKRDSSNRWGPRTVDLDLLLYADRVIDEPGLVVPHPRLHERRFVLEPLAQIAPGWTVPTTGRAVADLLASLPRGDAANNPG